MYVVGVQNIYKMCCRFNPFNIKCAGTVDLLAEVTKYEHNWSAWRHMIDRGVKGDVSQLSTRDLIAQETFKKQL